MSFKTASAILRGRWLIDKNWAALHMPLIVSVLSGKGSFAGLYDDKEYRDDAEDKQAAVKVLSNKYGSVYKVSAYTDLSRLPQDSIAMLTIAGPVTKYGDMCSYGSVDHVATINRLANSPNIKGIILNIDSPGGEAAGTAMLADAIQAAGGKKPIVSMIDDGIAASAAMWIASASHEIYTTQKTDMVGSIGVYTTVADWYAYFAKEGLNVRDVYAPQSTDKNADYKEALKGNDEPIKAELQVLAQEFIDTVAKNRAGKIQGSDWATGKMYYSKEAQRIGLIDGQKSLDQVVRRMNTLISQKEQSSNSNNMAFEKTLAVAKTESFEVVDGGFLLEEAALNNIEAALIFAANLEEANASLMQGAEQANAALETGASALASANDTIAALNLKIEELGKGDAKKPSAAAGEAEIVVSTEKAGWDKYKTSVDAEMEKQRSIMNTKF
jgi:signal peptide peptidase SppA